MQGGSCRTVMMEGNGAGSLGGLWVCGCTGRLTVGPPESLGGGGGGQAGSPISAGVGGFCRGGTSFRWRIGSRSVANITPDDFLINLSSFYLNIART